MSNHFDLQALQIAELLCTRLCHDLTGPIGAVNNGTEFIAEENAEMQQAALELIASSAKEASTRLQFYRRAFGKVSGEGEADLASLRLLTSTFYASTRITLDWPERYAASLDVALSKAHARLLANLLLLAGSTLIRGGTLSVSIPSTSQGFRLEIKTNGQGAKLDPELASALSSGAPLEMLSAKTVQAWLAARLAGSLGIALSFSESENAVEFVAEYARK